MKTKENNLQARKSSGFAIAEILWWGVHRKESLSGESTFPSKQPKYASFH